MAKMGLVCPGLYSTIVLNRFVAGNLEFWPITCFNVYTKMLCVYVSQLLFYQNFSIIIITFSIYLFVPGLPKYRVAILTKEIVLFSVQPFL